MSRSYLLLQLILLVSPSLALACPEGYVRMDECTCYRVKDSDLTKGELGGTSVEIDTAAPTIAAADAPKSCAMPAAGNDVLLPSKPEAIPEIIVNEEPPPQPSTCPAGFRQVGMCDCVENAGTRVKPRLDASEACQEMEAQRRRRGRDSAIEWTARRKEQERKAEEREQRLAAQAREAANAAAAAQNFALAAQAQAQAPGPGPQAAKAPGGGGTCCGGCAQKVMGHFEMGPHDHGDQELTYDGGGKGKMKLHKGRMPASRGH